MALGLGPEALRRQSPALRDRADCAATLTAFAGLALVPMGEQDRL